MTPFQEFRLWARRAPRGERVAAGVATLVVLASLGWALQPSGSGGTDLANGLATSDGATSAGANSAGKTPGGAPAAPLPGAAVPTPSVPGSAGRTTNGAMTSGGGTGGVTTSSGSTRGCAAPPSSADGVSATQIKIAVTLIQVVGAAANSTFAIPEPKMQEAEMQAQIDAANAAGGLACRKIVPTYFTANVADQNDLQQKCLDVVAIKPFAVLDIGAYSTSAMKECFAQHHIPYFGNYYLVAGESEKFYPYLFDLQSDNRLYRDTIFALRDRGFFSAANGFKKIGFIYRNCFPELVNGVETWLKQAGVPSSAIVTYSVGCPSYFATPSDLEQAVLKFQQAGVTHMTIGYFLGDFPNFTSVAERQGFRPKYGLPDDALISISAASTHPDYNNINGAVSISASRDAENTTPGMKPTAGTQRCDAVLKARGLPTTYQEPEVAGNACDQLWMFMASVEHAPALQQSALAVGLQRTKSIDFSFPQGPNDFTGDHVTTGGQFWRVTQFTTVCNCWRIVDRTFHRSYP